MLGARWMGRCKRDRPVYLEATTNFLEYIGRYGAKSTHNCDRVFGFCFETV